MLGVSQIRTEIVRNCFKGLVKTICVSFFPILRGILVDIYMFSPVLCELCGQLKYR